MVTAAAFSCGQCPLRKHPVFRPLSRSELAFRNEIRGAPFMLRARGSILDRGSPSKRIYTLRAGWAYRYRALPSGERQIIDFLLPGDLIGLHAALCGQARHGVQAITEVCLCPLNAEKFDSALSSQAELTRGLVETLLLDEQRYERRLLLLGQQRATERVCFLMLELRERLIGRGLGQPQVCSLPLTYQQMADALGLARSQLARSLAELKDRRWAVVANGQAVFTAPAEMAKFCGYDEAAGARLRTLV